MTIHRPSIYGAAARRCRHLRATGGAFLLRVILAALMLLLTARLGRAAGHMSTRQSGVIVSVDPAKRSFVFQPDGASCLVFVIWRAKFEFFGGNKTEFFDGALPANATILRRGRRVFVRYREALFAPNAALTIRSLDAPADDGVDPRS